MTDDNQITRVWRATAEEDFEDRPEHFWAFIGGDPHESTDPNVWLDHAGEHEGDPDAEEYFFRGAAARGSIIACGELMRRVYHSEFDDWEAWRWAQRVITLADKGALIPDGVTPELKSRMRSDAVKYIQSIENAFPPRKDGSVYINIPAVTDDIGDPDVFNYCLKCGRLRKPSAPLDQCDDSVHLVLRSFGSKLARTSEPEAIVASSAEGTTPNFCGNCGTALQGDSRFCSQCGAKR